MAARSANQRTKIGEKLTQYVLALIVAVIVWVLVVLLTSVRVEGWLWGWVLLLVALLIAWAIYDAIDDRVEARAGLVYRLGGPKAGSAHEGQRDDGCLGDADFQGTDLRDTGRRRIRSPRAEGRPHRRAAPHARRARLRRLAQPHVHPPRAHRNRSLRPAQ